VGLIVRYRSAVAPSCTSDSVGSPSAIRVSSGTAGLGAIALTVSIRKAL
jgi:hypothetical protein